MGPFRGDADDAGALGQPHTEEGKQREEGEKERERQRPAPHPPALEMHSDVGLFIVMTPAEYFSVIVGNRNTIKSNDATSTVLGYGNGIEDGSDHSVLIGSQLGVNSSSQNAIVIGIFNSGILPIYRVGLSSPEAIVVGTNSTIGDNSPQSLVIGSDSSVLDGFSSIAIGTGANLIGFQSIMLGGSAGGAAQTGNQSIFIWIATA